jgi:signal transduction histidine kinase
MYPLFEQLLEPALHVEGWAYDGAKLARLRQDVLTTTDRIRALIGKEVAHTGIKEDELAELHQLALLERNLLSILDATEAALQRSGSDSFQGDHTEIAEIIEVQINQGFMHLLEEALGEENREVTQTDRDGRVLLNRVTYVTAASVAVAIIVGLGVLVMLRRRLNIPLEGLMDGTLAVASGDLGFRLEVTGRDEFSGIAKRFNEMAAQLQRHQRQTVQNQQALERRVDERTEQLRLAYDDLGRADQARRRFFADISHELRTPLTVIRGEAQFALRGTDKAPEVYKDTLQRVVEQTEQVRRLVDDLLFIARVDGGAPRLERSAVLLDQLLETVCSDAQALAIDKAIQIELRVEAVPSIVSGDHGRLRQLFLILLDNAIRYSCSGSSIIVWMGSDQRSVTVEVRDSGVGIPEVELELVFERFYRGSNAANTGVDGLGLGLPMAKAIVVAHGGDISVHSTMDQGTVFAINLPAGSQPQAAA